MKKFLLLCLLTVSMVLSAQITLGEGSTSTGIAPVNTYYGYSYTQQIFTKQEINANAAGNITGLKFYIGPNENIDDSDEWTVYLGHTGVTNFASTTSWVPLSELTEVYSGTVTNENGVVEVVFTTPFSYNNTQNLVVAIDENAPGYDGNNIFHVFGASSTQYKTIAYRNDDTNPDPATPPTGSLIDYRSVVTFTGLTPSSIPLCTTINYPANNSNAVPALPEIKWSSMSGATGYKVSIGTTPGGTDVVNQQLVSTTTFTPTAPLALNTTYYLRVISVGTGGDASGCTEFKFKTVPPQPANDECIGAVNLTVNPDMNCASSVAGSTLSATDSGLDPDPCYGNADDDVWYKFTATQTSHIVSLMNVTSAGSENSTSLNFQILSGGCDGLSSLVCGDSGSAVASNLTVGETYYVRVYSYFGDGYAQNFNICVGTLPPPPTNDDCTTAVTLTVNQDMNCGVKTSGHTLGASDSGVDITPCEGEADDDVWYKFTATATSHFISLSNMVSIGEEYSYGAAFQVFNGDCTNLTSMVCSQSYEGSKLVTGFTVGQTYYIRVFTEYSDEAQSFDICIGTIPPVPANDECANALVASVFPYNYTQSDAAGATNNSGFITACANNGMNDGTWFTFTGDGSVHNITVSIPADSYFDAEIGVFTGSCGNFTCVGRADSGSSGEEETISVSTVAGTVYYVNVGGYADDEDQVEGTFTITINKETLGTSETSKVKKEIKVYPNPFTEVLNISKVEDVKSIYIVDVSGRMVKTIDKPSSSLYLADLKQGMYIVVLNMKDGSKQTVKTIKK